MTGRHRSVRSGPSSARWLALIVLPFLCIAVVLLLGWPGDTATHFAWTIRPRLTAVILGAAYVGGIVAFSAMLAEPRWHRVRRTLLPVLVFATMLAVATVMHWDAFHHGSASFVAWATLYLTTPLALAGVMLATRGRDDGSGEPHPAVPRWLRIVLAAIGALTGLLGAALFVAPEAIAPAWPWLLTPLTGRIVGAALVLPALVDLAMLVDARWSAFRVLFIAQIVSLAAICIGVVTTGDVRWERPASVPVVVGLAATLAIYVAVFVGMERRDRRTRRSHRGEETVVA